MEQFHRRLIHEEFEREGQMYRDHSAIGGIKFIVRLLGYRENTEPKSAASDVPDIVKVDTKAGG
jgi:hypothetical protein